MSQNILSYVERLPCASEPYAIYWIVSSLACPAQSQTYNRLSLTLWLLLALFLSINELNESIAITWFYCLNDIFHTSVNNLEGGRGVLYTITLAIRTIVIKKIIKNEIIDQETPIFFISINKLECPFEYKSWMKLRRFINNAHSYADYCDCSAYISKRFAIYINIDRFISNFFPFVLRTYFIHFHSINQTLFVLNYVKWMSYLNCCILIICVVSLVARAHSPHNLPPIIIIHQLLLI